MKKLLIIAVLLIGSVGFIFAEDDSNSGSGYDFTFSLGGSVQYETPLLAGGKYNEDFAAKNKPLNIDDFLLGLDMRADFMWDKIGVRLDLMAFYNPTADYTALGETLASTVSIENLVSGENPLNVLEEIEHGMKFVFNPMFNYKGSLVGVSVGPGVSFSWNISQGVEAMKAIKGEEGGDLSASLTRIGLDPADFDLSNGETLFNETLTFSQQLAFLGSELDFNLKAGVDFYIGKITIGINYIWDLNTNLALWQKDGDFGDNMKAIFDVQQTKGYLGGSVLYSF